MKSCRERNANNLKYDTHAGWGDSRYTYRNTRRAHTRSVRVALRKTYVG